MEQGMCEIPLYLCPAAGFARPPKCSYDAAAMAGRAIVVDNGSHSIRAGWAGDASPSVVFRSAISKPRPRQGPGYRTVVGEWGPGLSGWDFGKHTHRYCFEGDVPINLEGQEALMDWALDRMGITGGAVSHPLLLTEAPLMPNPARTQLAQLLFEGYGIPCLSFVAAAPAAFYHHYQQHWQQQQQQQGSADGVLLPDQQQQQQLNGVLEEQFCGSSSGLVVCSGHSYTYVVPVYKGQPQWGAAMRCWAAGASSTSHLQQVLGIKYPAHANGLLGNWQLVEGLKEGFCSAAMDYREQLRIAQAYPDSAGGMAVRVQLPFVPTAAAAAAAAKPAPTPLDLALKAQEARVRGKALAERQKRKVLEEKEAQLAVLLGMQAGPDGDAAAAAAGGASSLRQEEVNRQITELTAEVDRLRGHLSHDAATPTPPPGAAAATPPPTEAAAAVDDVEAAAAVEAAPAPDLMQVDTAATAEAAAAQLPATSLAAAADSTAADDSAAAGAAAGATTTADAENDADDENGDENDDEGDSSATVSDKGLPGAATAGTAAAAMAAAAAAATAAKPTAAAGDDDADDAAASSGDHSSSTVTDDGLCQQEELMQEVLQQVKQIRKQRRQGSKQQLQLQQQQQQPQQPQQQPQQQQLEEFNYLGIPDNMLTAEQIKIKRRQQLLHAGRMARERAAARKAQQQAEREAMMRMEDEQLATDPFSYLAGLQQRHSSAAARVEARKRRRLGQAALEEEGGDVAPGVQGRRRDEKHRMRMRLIAQAAATARPKPKSKKEKLREARQRDKKGRDKKGDGRRDKKGPSSEEEEGFGDDGADWEVYRAMDMRDSDSEAEAEEAAELAWTTQRIQQIRAAVAEAAAATVAAAAAATTAAMYADGSAAAAAAGVGDESAGNGVMSDTAAAAAGNAAAAAAATAASREVSLEPPESTTGAAAVTSDSAPSAAAGFAATGATAAGESSMLQAAAAAIAGQLVTMAYANTATAYGESAAYGQQAYGQQYQQQGLAGLDLSMLGLGGLGFGEGGVGFGGAQAPAERPVTAEDYQVVLGVERIRVPELLMQPAALAGVDEAGLPEVVGLALKRLPRHMAEAVAAGGVVLTGGNLLYPGMLQRIQAELATLRPPDRPMPIFVSRDPLLDTWRGAAALAAATGRTAAAAAAAVGVKGVESLGLPFPDPFAAAGGALSQQLYAEAGVDYLREFRGFRYPQL